MNASSPGPVSVKVSVAMITYNHEAFIEQAIESVLMQQTDFEYELVIGEDCSTDGTRAIVRAYAERYTERIRLILPGRNQGAAANFTATLKACRGSYIAFLDGDDYWIDPKKLQKQVGFLEGNSDYVMCFHNVWVFHKESKYDYFLNYGLNKDTFDTEDIIIRDWFIGSASMVFRNIINTFPLWIMKCISVDMAFHLLISDNGKLKYIDEVMSVYRIHKGGAMSMFSNGANTDLYLSNRVMMYEAFDKYTKYKYTKHIAKKVNDFNIIKRRYLRRKPCYSLISWFPQHFAIPKIALRRRVKRFFSLNYNG